MPGLAEAFERIGLALEHHLEHSHAAGAALAVTDGEEILGVAVRGLADVAAGTPVRPETRFQIGSISKSFAGIVALQEAEAGRLDLHVSVNEILPWLDLPEPFGPITLHHLMTHTSGLAIGTEDAAHACTARSGSLRTLPPTTAPRGARSGTPTTAGRSSAPCLEHVTGMPVTDLLMERVLGPRRACGRARPSITDEARQDWPWATSRCCRTGRHSSVIRWRPPRGRRDRDGRRLDRLRRRRHERLRAAAAGAR